MTHFFASVLILFGILALYYMTRMFYFGRYKEKLYIAFSATAFASGCWSIGYGFMILESGMEMFRLYRSISIFGMFLYLIAAQFMVGIVAGLSKKYFYFFCGESVFATIILFLVYNRNVFILENKVKGLSVAFRNDAVSFIYVGFIIFLTMAFFALLLIILGKKYTNSIRTFGKMLLLVVLFIGIFLVIDTFLPMSGYKIVFPTSTLLQFVGLQIMYKAVNTIEKNKVNVQNMSGYIYKNVKSPVLVFDKDNSLKIANKIAKDMFDISSDEDFSGIDFWNDYYDMLPPTFNEKYDETIIVDRVCTKKDMHSRLYISAIMDDYNDFIGYIVMISDMTVLLRYTKELEKSKEEALKSSNDKNIFLANMSHEMRTPMNSILGFSELALNDDESNSKEYMEYIHDSAKTLIALINDILDISKIEAGKASVVTENYYTKDLLGEVNRVIELQAAKKSLEYSVDVSPSFPVQLKGDREKIRSMLINLLKYAVNHTNVGTITLSADFCHEGDNGGIAEFVIKDTGMGIKKEEMDAVFDVFGSSHNSMEGSDGESGLGLAIAKRYAEMMGGDITIESVYGEGTAYTMEIPQSVVEPDHPDDTVKSTDDKNTRDFSRLSFLAVDDTSVNLKLISSIMEGYGVSIDTSISGERAIKMCNAKSYDIIFMDQMMPGLDGIETMKRIRELGNGYEAGGACKIIALTANAIEGAREKLLSEGFDGYLSKPIDINKLEKAIISVIN